MRRALLEFAIGLLMLLGMAPGASADDQVEPLGVLSPPSFGEWQDVTLANGRLYMFSVGGISVVDVDDPANPVQLGMYPLPWEQLFYRCYRGDVRGDLLVAGRRENGIALIDLGDEAAPALLSEHVQAGVSHEGVVLLPGGDLLYAAAHAAGLEIVDVGDPLQPQSLGFVTGLENAWDVALADGHAFVADGAGGLAVLDIADPALPQHLYSLPTEGGALDIELAGDLAVLACGSGGVEIFDVSEPGAAIWLGNYDSGGLAANLAVSGDTLYLADWDDIEIVDISEPTSPSRIGWERTIRRAMGLDVAGDLVYVADWSRLRSYRFGPTANGDLDLPLTGIAFEAVPFGASADTLFPVVNTGGGALQVTSVQSFNPNFVVSPPASFELAPGETRMVGLTFTPAAPGYDATFIRVDALDSDEPQLSFPVQADDDPDRLDLGESAPDFMLLDLDGVPRSLSAELGRVVVLAFFANW